METIMILTFFSLMSLSVENQNKLGKPPGNRFLIENNKLWGTHFCD